MDKPETAAVLAVAAAFDNRNVTTENVEAWSRALHPDMGLDDARQIIIDHYAENTEWLKPAHLNHAYKQLRRHRLEAIGTQHRPPGILTADQETVWLKTFRNAVANGATLEQAEIFASKQFGTQALEQTTATQNTTTANEDDAERAKNIQRLRDALKGTGDTQN